MKSNSNHLTALLGLMFALTAGVGTAAGQEAPDRIAAGLEARLKVQTAVVMLSGAWKSDDFTLHIRELPVHDLPRSLYIQMIRTDDPLDTQWRQVWSLHLVGNELDVRVSEFAPETDYGAIFTGAWAAPEKFPPIARSRLYAVGDLRAKVGRRTIRLAADSPFPTLQRAVHHLDMEIAVEGDRLDWRTTGLTARGEPAWGAETMTFRRFKHEPAVVEHENGLVAIDLLEGDGREARTGDEIRVGYTGYVMTGHAFYSTEWQGEEAVRTTLPAEYIEGWNLGIIGMKPGGVRRIIVPPWLGYGMQPRGMIPPNSWLIFDLELKGAEPADADAESRTP